MGMTFIFPYPAPLFHIAKLLIYPIFVNPSNCSQGYEIGVGYNNMTILNNPAYIHARKMSQLLKNQDVVATCRYMLFKTYKTFYEAEAACAAMGGNWELTTVGNVTLADIYGYQENVDIASLMHIAWGPDYLVHIPSN
eukprot:sb/3474469/